MGAAGWGGREAKQGWKVMCLLRASLGSLCKIPGSFRAPSVWPECFQSPKDIHPSVKGPGKTHGSWWWWGTCPGEPKEDLREPRWTLAGEVLCPLWRGSPLGEDPCPPFFLPNFPLFPVLIISAPDKGISRPLLDYIFPYMFLYFHSLCRACLLLHPLGVVVALIPSWHTRRLSLQEALPDPQVRGACPPALHQCFV